MFIYENFVNTKTSMDFNLESFWKLVVFLGLGLSVFTYVINSNVDKEIAFVGWSIIGIILVLPALGVYKLIRIKTNDDPSYFKTDPKWIGVFAIGFLMVAVTAITCVPLGCKGMIENILIFAGILTTIISGVQMFRKYDGSGGGITFNTQWNDTSKRIQESRFHFPQPQRHRCALCSVTPSLRQSCTMCGGSGWSEKR
jgi:hypothetical protein